MPAVKERREAISAAVAELDELDAAGEALEEGRAERAAKRLAKARDLRLRTAPPVPVSVAAELLGVSLPTVRRWADRGVLEDLGVKPRAVSVASVARVRRLLERLRGMGRDANLREALLARLDDALTLEDEQLRRSLRQMRAGKRKHYVHGR